MCISYIRLSDLSQAPWRENRGGGPKAPARGELVVEAMVVLRLVPPLALLLGVVVHVADALALVLERRMVEVLPAAPLALVLGGRRADERDLCLPVCPGLPDGRRPLDVDQDRGALDRPGREGHLVAGGGERLLVERVGGPVRDDVVAAEEERGG